MNKIYLGSGQNLELAINLFFQNVFLKIYRFSEFCFIKSYFKNAHARSSDYHMMNDDDIYLI